MRWLIPAEYMDQERRQEFLTSEVGLFLMVILEQARILEFLASEMVDS